MKFLTIVVKEIITWTDIHTDRPEWNYCLPAYVDGKHSLITENSWNIKCIKIFLIVTRIITTMIRNVLVKAVTVHTGPWYSFVSLQLYNSFRTRRATASTARYKIRKVFTEKWWDKTSRTRTSEGPQHYPQSPDRR